MFTKEELINIYDELSKYNKFDDIKRKYEKHINLGNYYIASIISESNSAKKLGFQLTPPSIPESKTVTNNSKFKSDGVMSEIIAKELKRLPEKDMANLIYWSMRVVKSSKPKWIDFLIKLQGNEIKDFVERNPSIISTAAEFDMKNVINFFINKGIDITTEGFFKNKALWEAAHKGYDEMMKILLDAGAEVDFAISHQTVLSENKKALDLIISRGARFDSEKFGITLAEIIERGNIDFVKTMLENGMDPRVNGHYAFNICYKKSQRGKNKRLYSEMYKLLEKHLNQIIIQEYQQQMLQDESEAKKL